MYVEACSKFILPPTHPHMALALHAVTHGCCVNAVSSSYMRQLLTHALAYSSVKCKCTNRSLSIFVTNGPNQFLCCTMHQMVYNVIIYSGAKWQYYYII